VTSPRRLDTFTGAGYDKGRGVLWQVAWFAVSHLLFQAWWLPARFRPVILRAFGAHVGAGCNIRNSVRIHWPWKLTLGDHVWIGEGALLLNLEQITVGSHVCISQDAALCTGSHDVRSPSFEYDNAPITIGDGAWITLRAAVLRGVTVPEGGLAPAGAVVRRASDCVLDTVSTVPSDRQAAPEPRTPTGAPTFVAPDAVLPSSAKAGGDAGLPSARRPIRRARGLRSRSAEDVARRTSPTVS
jgi:putative colanic acid biosynthesis acetyltransferase WcaF